MSMLRWFSLCAVALVPTRALADWSAFYASLHADARVPPFAARGGDELEWVVQDDLVDLAELTTDARFRRAAPYVTYVFADVLRIPAGYSHVLADRAMVVVARRIEVERDATVYLDFRRSQSATLAVYAGEWAGTLGVVGFDELETPAEEILLGAGPLETLVAHDGERAASFTGDSVPFELFVPGGELMRTLERALIAESALVAEDVAPRLALLDWVVRVASRAPEGSDPRYAQLAADAAAQLAFWQAEARGNHVPELDREVYLDVAASQLAAVERYEAQYDRFTDRSLGTAQRAAAARLMLDQASAAVQAQGVYLEQAQRTAHGAAGTVAQAERNFQRQEETLALARIRFQAGIELWRHDMTVRAVFGAIEALLNFAAAAAGGMAGGVKPDDLAAQIKAVADVARATAAAMTSLQKAIDATNTLSSGSKKLASAVEHADERAIADAARALDSLEGALLFAEEGFGDFARESRTLLKFAIDQSVPGALQYEFELVTLAERGRTLIEARRMEARAHQEIAQLLLAARFASENEQRVRKLVVRFETDQARDTQLASVLFERMIALKRPLYLALLDYGAAYRYWSLKDPSLSMSLLDDAASLRTTLAELTRAYAGALTSFAQPPQRFQHKTLAIDDAASLERFRATGELTVSVPLASAVFRGLERVRLEGVRVWFEGASCPLRRCFATLRTSGRYEDRSAGRSLTFSGPSLLRLFEYQTDTTGSATILIDGQLADRLAFAYFEPTPFSDWTVGLSDAHNPGLDRSAVERIVLEWSGSAVAAAR